MSSYIINIENTSGDKGSVIADAGFDYSDKLSEINEANIKISGTGETKRGLLEVGSIVKIYRNAALEFHGICDNIDYFEGGGIAIHASGYERWLAFENGAYSGSPWSATASATIFSAVIGESTKFTAGTVNAGISVDFRAEITDSLWNVLSNLSQATQQDIGIDYIDSEVDILDHKGSSTTVATFNAGIQMGDVQVSQSYPLGNDVRVYGKSEGETRIKSDAAQGQDATSKSTYGTIVKVIRDPKITTVAQANIVANAEVARIKDPIKVYDFEILNPNQNLVSGDVITLNSKTQGLSNEEVRIVGLDKGMKGGKEFLTLRVTNAAYSKLIKSTNEIIAGVEKEIRDNQTYDIYADEYSNANSYTTIGGFINAGKTGGIVGFAAAVSGDDFWIQTGGSGDIYLSPGTTGWIKMTGTQGLNLGYNPIVNVTDPTNAQDAATKNYVDLAGGGDNLGNHTATQNLNINQHGITNCAVGLASGIGNALNLQPGTTIVTWGILNINDYDIDNVENLEVNDVYDHDQGYIKIEDELVIDNNEQISADIDNLILLGGDDPVSVGTGGVPGSADDLFVYGDFDVNGTKSCVVTTDDGRKIIYSVVESPEIWFEEKMSSKLKNGRKEIILDERFLATTEINDKHPLHVVASPAGDCNGLWVEKKLDRVIVHESIGGTSNAAFDMVVSAKRKGYADYRFDEYVEDPGTGVRYKKSKKKLFFAKKPLKIQAAKIKESKKEIFQEIKSIQEKIRKTKEVNEIEKEKKELNEKKKQYKEKKSQIMEIRSKLLSIEEEYKKGNLK